MRIYLSAGEHSGDMHAAVLARALRSRNPGVDLVGMGGSLMRGAGVDLLLDPTTQSTIGFVEALMNYRRFRRVLREVSLYLERRRPDVVVWVDFGGFNLALAKECRRIGIPVVCVFAPSAWAYGQKRALLMAERVTELAAVLPFEAEFYRSAGLKVTFVGHPLLDLVHPSKAPAEFRSSLGISEDESILALLPGSRIQEIRRLLPVMLEAANRLASEGRKLRPILPLASTISRKLAEELIARSGSKATIVEGRAYDVLAASKAAVIGSGTATLEAAILGVPLVSIYRVSSLSLWIYLLMRNPAERGKPYSTALPNLVAGRRVVPELLQENLSPESLTRETARILDDNGYRQTMIADLHNVCRALGAQGAMDRVAEIVIRTAANE